MAKAVIRKQTAGPKHMFIPDTQVKPGVDTDHIEWAGIYAGLKKPDTLIQAGDFYDFSSLSSYDRGKRSSHGKEYQLDINAGDAALARFEKGLRKYGGRGYKPRKVVTLGNHEIRLLRYVEDNPEMHGKVSLEDLGFKRHGWEVVPFLLPILIDGITYCHYFPIGPNGRVVNSKHGAPSAKAQVQRFMGSATAGHRQGLDTAIVHTGTATYRGLIAGSFYQHTEEYLTPMGNNVWQGILMKHDVQTKTGEYNLMEIDLRFLARKFG